MAWRDTIFKRPENKPATVSEPKKDLLDGLPVLIQAEPIGGPSGVDEPVSPSPAVKPSKKGKTETVLKSPVTPCSG